MTSLVIAEHDNKTLLAATANVVAAAKQLGGDVDILVMGSDCQQVAEQAAQLDGVAKVLVASADYLQHQLVEDTSAVIEQLAEKYNAVLAPATTMGKNLIPRVGALLDIQPLSDVIEIESPKQFKRPIYAGNVIASVETSDAKLALTVRATAFEPVASGGNATIEPVTPGQPSGLSEFVEEKLAASDRPDLTSAKIVISGGRGLANADNFQLLYDLADKLGAAVGASRAAVDAGFVPNDMQVGQTGKIVAPDLYIAFGISGAIQHLAGMKSSKVIVAVNSDEDAPIFQVADYGLVGDLFQVLPELKEKL